MGPVSFQRLGVDMDRASLLDAARLLTDAGVQVQSITEGQGLLVRSDDLARAKEILDRLR